MLKTDGQVNRVLQPFIAPATNSKYVIKQRISQFKTLVAELLLGFNPWNAAS